MEIWKTIPWSKDHEASNLGRVRRITSCRGRPAGYIFKAQPRNKKGYLMYSFYLSGKPKHYMVHYVILATFKGPRPKGMQINHKDGNKENNSLENLEYVTPSQNAKHAIENNLYQKARGEKNAASKLTEKQVREIRKKTKKGYASRTLGREYGVSKTAILKIVNGENWSYLH